MEMIKVVTKMPNEEPVITEMENSCEGIKEILKGYFEVIRWGKYDVLVDDEGRLKGLPYNVTIRDYKLVGPVIVTKDETEDFITLTDEEAEEIVQKLKEKMN